MSFPAYVFIFQDLCCCQAFCVATQLQGHALQTPIQAAMFSSTYNKPWLERGWGGGGSSSLLSVPHY